MKLFIIGNGFDLAHGYKTSFKDFRDFLDENNCMVGSFSIPDIFNEVTKEDWNDFENLLGTYDFKGWGESYVKDTLVQHEKEEDSALSHNIKINEDYEKIVGNLRLSLGENLCRFIIDSTSHPANKRPEVEDLRKPRDIFLTFNYSLTLENVFQINKSKILHIHKTVNEGNAIIFGHGKLNLRQSSSSTAFNLETPEIMLSNLNYLLKKNYKLPELEKFVKDKNITQFIIMGHGLGEVDKPYFEELNKLCHKVQKVTFFFHWNTNDKDKDDLQKKIEKKSEMDRILHNLFPGKKIEIKEWRLLPCHALLGSSDIIV